jgi:hypothetical protein
MKVGPMTAPRLENLADHGQIPAPSMKNSSSSRRWSIRAMPSGRMASCNNAITLRICSAAEKWLVGLPAGRSALWYVAFTGRTLLCQLALGCVHALVTTPVDSLGACCARCVLFPGPGSCPRDASLRPISTGSASTLPFSKLAQRSLALRPEHFLSCSHSPFPGVLDRFCFLHQPSRRFRVER